MSRLATGFPEGFYLIVKGLPVSSQDMRSVDDHIDFGGARFNSLLDFPNALGQGGLASREAGGNRGNRNSRCLSSASTASRTRLG